MNHFASQAFWELYHGLPDSIRAVADKNFSLLKDNPAHPSLHFKKVGKYRSVRVGRNYRALAVEIGEGLLWLWIGSHADYDRMLDNWAGQHMPEACPSSHNNVMHTKPDLHVF